jgi:hypothetical protein
MVTWTATQTLQIQRHLPPSVNPRGLFATRVWPLARWDLGTRVHLMHRTRLYFGTAGARVMPRGVNGTAPPIRE